MQLEIKRKENNVNNKNLSKKRSVWDAFTKDETYKEIAWIFKIIAILGLIPVILGAATTAICPQLMHQIEVDGTRFVTDWIIGIFAEMILLVAATVIMLVYDGIYYLVSKYHAMSRSTYLPLTANEAKEYGLTTIDEYIYYVMHQLEYKVKCPFVKEPSYYIYVPTRNTLNSSYLNNEIADAIITIFSKDLHEFVTPNNESSKNIWLDVLACIEQYEFNCDICGRTSWDSISAITQQNVTDMLNSLRGSLQLEEMRRQAKAIHMS